MTALAVILSTAALIGATWAVNLARSALYESATARREALRGVLVCRSVEMKHPQATNDDAADRTPVSPWSAEATEALK